MRHQNDSRIEQKPGRLSDSKKVNRLLSVYKHSLGKTPYFIAVFAGANGRQRHRSTKLTDRAKATSVAEKWEREARILQKELPSNNRDLVLETFITATQRAVTRELRNDGERHAESDS